VFHGLEPSDHRFDARAYLVVAIEQTGLFLRQKILPLSQRTILFLELVHSRNEFIDALFQPLEFQFRAGGAIGVRHEKTITSLSYWCRARTQVTSYRNYPEIQRLMAQSHALTEPAEAHGTLAGALCAALGYGLQDWLAEILPEGPVPADTGEALRGLYDETRGALTGAAMEFDLLMPDDDQSIEDRTQALCLWCNGFLYGLGTNGAGDPQRLPGDAGEIVRDLTQISQAGVDRAEGQEANESALAELVEFVRVGVQVVFEELGTLRELPAPTPTQVLH
jgi:uncharacterized protein YgfB (UPF0149 family)